MKIAQLLAGLTIAGIIVIGGYLVASNQPGFNGGMTSSQINAMERQLTNSFAASMKNARMRTSFNSGLGIATVTISLDYTTTCSTGGYIHTLGGWSGRSSQSMGHFSFHATQTIHNWKCIAGWVVNGDPYISYTGTVSGISSNITSSIGQSMGWKASKTGEKVVKQSCQSRGDVAYSSNGLGHANIHLTCKPGGELNYAMTL